MVAMYPTYEPKKTYVRIPKYLSTRTAGSNVTPTITQLILQQQLLLHTKENQICNLKQQLQLQKQHQKQQQLDIDLKKENLVMKKKLEYYHGLFKNPKKLNLVVRALYGGKITFYSPYRPIRWAAKKQRFMMKELLYHDLI